jgi:putative membrane protein
MKIRQNTTLRYVILPAQMIALILMAGFDAYAEDEHGSGRSVDEILQEIRERQNLEKDDRIDAHAVDEALLEELGETVMALMVPDPKRHEWMDRMMGGEGSDALAEHHRWMGYRYLRGGWGMMGPMMGRDGRWGGMTGFSPFNRCASWGLGPMGFGHGGPVAWIAITLLAAAVIVVAILLVNKRRSSTASDFLGIVKSRFARGEISQEEYEQLRRDLK